MVEACSTWRGSMRLVQVARELTSSTAPSAAVVGRFRAWAQAPSNTKARRTLSVLLDRLKVPPVLGGETVGATISQR